MEPIRVKANLKEVPVIIEDGDGKELNCFLREMTGTKRDKYLNSMSGNLKFINGKVSGLKNYDGVQNRLLTRCLFKPDGEAFDSKELDEFPCSVLNQLFEIAQKLNGLDKDAEDDAKND